MRYFLSFIVILYVFAACQNRKPVSPQDVSPNDVYYDYRISGEEGRADATLRLQYKTGDEDGEAIAWEPPAKVLLDDVEIKADSSHFTGAYYELIKPIDELKGKHRIVFLDPEGKEHKEDFNFVPLSLAEEIPETLAKKPLQIKLAAAPNSTKSVRLVITDTSLYSRGINETMMVQDGSVNVSEQQLANLMPGPLMLEIYLEDERPIKKDPKNRGVISIAYAIKRELVLVD